MKKSEKIGIGVTAILAIILVIVIWPGNKSEIKKNFCDGICIPTEPETWAAIDEPITDNDDNNFSTKEECINACLEKK